MNNPDTIIERIKTRRLELDLSYQQLAALTDISKSTLQRYETGFIKNLAVEKLEVLASALKTSPAYLMGWEETPKIEEPKLTPEFDKIESAEEAMEFILKQPALAAYGGYNVHNIPEKDLINFANELLSHLKYISFKYQNNNNNF